MSESSSRSGEDKPILSPAATSESPSVPKSKETELPPPVEIAKIAAILSRDRNLQASDIDNAIKLFLRADIRCEELSKLSLDQIAEKVGALDVLDLLAERAGTSRKLRLYPDRARIDEKTRKDFFNGDLDQVRSYLDHKAQYLRLKTTRSVLDSIRLYFLKKAFDHNERYADSIKKFEEQLPRLAREQSENLRRTVTIDEIRNGVAVSVQTQNDQRRRDGEAEYEEFIERAAARDDKEKVIYWELTESFLNKLISFRRSVKETPGGIQALRNWLLPRPSSP